MLAADSHATELDLDFVRAQFPALGSGWALLGDRNRLVCFSHCSNVTGGLQPLEEIVALAPAHGAEVCVNGVAFALHRAIDLAAWDVDYYAFSFYKLFGPHLALLYGKPDALRAPTNLNHVIIENDDIPYKLQPGGANYELSYASGDCADYFIALAEHHGVRGDSATLPPRVDPHRIGIRYGHFYADRFIDALGLTQQNGVVRVSLVHYNTAEEIARLCDVLDAQL